MAINFNELPNRRPTTAVPEGTYYADISKAEMRTPKDDPSKPDYLNLELKLSDKNGNACGTVYDIISESDKDLVRFKTARFIRAVKLADAFAAAGTFNLKDLCKVVIGKKVIVDVGLQEASNGYSARNQVDVLKREGYYMPEEIMAFGGSDPVNPPPTQTPAPQNNDDDIPFNDAY